MTTPAYRQAWFIDPAHYRVMRLHSVAVWRYLRPRWEAEIREATASRQCRNAGVSKQSPNMGGRSPPGTRPLPANR